MFFSIIKSMSEQRNLSARKFNELVNSNEQLKKLYTHAKIICALNAKLHKHLAADLSSHFNVANYSDETLTVNADSSAWASKLRYCIPDILNYAKHECGLGNLRTVRIGVAPLQGQSTRDQNKSNQTNLPDKLNLRKASMSKKSAEFIKNVALAINDPALQKTILKLSKHAK